MKKKNVYIVCVLLAIVLLIPIPLQLKDGGTVEYKALVYRVLKVHRLAPVESGKEYEEGIIIKVLGIEVYNNVEQKNVSILKIRIIFLQAFYNRFNYASNLFVDYYDYENVSRETFIR